MPERRDRWRAEPALAEPAGGRRARMPAPARAEPGLAARLAKRLLARPARTGAILVAVVTAGTIIGNAAFLQSGRHPSPFFATRPAPQQPAAGIDAEPVSAVPVPRSRPEAADPLATLAAAPAAPATPAVHQVAAEPATDQATLVAAVQRALAEAGLYRGPVDGLSGPATREAIAAYERQAGLPATGRATPELLDLLRRTEAEAVAAAPADHPRADPRLLAVQEALNDIGYGPVKVDGLSGRETADAIRRFELDNGLTVSGTASDAVIGRLVGIGAMDPL